MKEIIFGKGQEYERVLLIKPAKGKKARQMMPSITAFMSKVAEADGSNPIAVMGEFWSTEEFEEIFVPYVLGLDNSEGRDFLENEGTPIDILNAFTEAATYLIGTSLNSPEVVEALKKLNDEAPEAPSNETES